MPIATVYRSVRVILQNSTNLDFSIHGVATLRGQWNDKATPKQSDLIGEQSAVAWVSESIQIGSGTSAFVRVGSLSGYVRMTWSLPWVGPFTFETESPEGIAAHVAIDDRQPDEAVVTVTLRTRERAEERLGDDAPSAS